jgi:hypothetical protein
VVDPYPPPPPPRCTALRTSLSDVCLEAEGPLIGVGPLPESGDRDRIASVRIPPFC